MLMINVDGLSRFRPMLLLVIPFYKPDIYLPRCTFCRPHIALGKRKFWLLILLLLYPLHFSVFSFFAAQAMKRNIKDV
jgi:hypothetical protein